MPFAKIFPTDENNYIIGKALFKTVAVPPTDSAVV
jgi:hypothetical protein